MSDDTTRLERLGVYIGMGIGYVICEPQLRLGRRRHDHHCDRCGDRCGAYKCERLAFPPEPDSETTLGKVRRMADATYTALCLECSADEEGRL